MNNPFDYSPDPICQNAIEHLLQRIDALRDSVSATDIKFLHHLQEGKMLGVLIAADSSGQLHTLYAFSGQIGDAGFQYPGFVEPVFDYLRPDGYFKSREKEISALNREIKDFEENVITQKEEKLLQTISQNNQIINELKAKHLHSKNNRKILRESGDLTDSQLRELIRQSQYEKAELHRLKKRLAEQIVPLEESLRQSETILKAMKSTRIKMSEDLQNWLFSNFKVSNVLGQQMSLADIFASTQFKIPPSGAGECCAPKLLQAAFNRALTPISMAEFWYGKSKSGEVRIHGRHYPACRGKCMPILSFMLRGVEVMPPLKEEFSAECSEEPEIIFQNPYFCVVSKPSGILSVPGKYNQPSVEEWLKSQLPAAPFVKMAHRLDQDTSGIIIAALTPEAYKLLQMLFARRLIKKQYIAELEGDYRKQGVPSSGSISLPLSPDILDRPRQRVDFSNGKSAHTDYRFISATPRGSRIIFVPHTGRTHQLRIHAASEEGLNMPITGDRLYGKRAGSEHSRLRLHAYKIEFLFPIDNQNYSFELPPPF